jgi:serpin B
MLLILVYSVLHELPVAASEAVVASKINSFGLKLLKNLPVDENTMISPFSICTAVAMLNAGAAGETKKQIDSAFGWSDSSDVPGQYKELLSKVGAGDDKLTLSSNNRLYIDNKFNPLQSYSDELSTNFAADVEAVNFGEGDNSATVEQINTWVEDKTNKKIKKLLSSVSNDVRAILINTIYFKANWMKPFKDDITQEEFYLDEKYAIKADTMHLEERLQYFENKDIELVKLPYASAKSPISMVVIKPKTRAGLSTLEKKIEYQFSEVSSWMSAVQPTLLDLSMPKLEFKAGVEDLKDILMNHFKVQDVFDPTKADLSGISSSESLFVSSIIHKSFISVDQYGTEAAAATAVIIGKTSFPRLDDPRVVKINQPFMFMIYDEDRNVVLFVGRMVHPNTANNAEKYLEASYSGSFRQLNDRFKFLLGMVLLAWLLIVHF